MGMMNEVPTSSQGPKGGNAQFLQDAKDMQLVDGHLTVEQLSNNEFHCTQDKRDLLAGVLHLQKALFAS